MIQQSIVGRLLAALAFAGVVGTPAFAAVPADHAELFAEYVRVVNAHDLAGLRALISEDAERSDYTACTPAMSNKDCLLFYVDTAVIKSHGNIEETGSFGVEGDIIYGGLILRSDTIRATGNERIYGIDKIKVKDGKIAGLKFLPNLRDAQTRQFFERRRAAGAPSAQPRVNPK